MNILITGAPGAGKTTLFRKLAGELRHLQPVGFYTEEIRQGGMRKGFALTGLDGRKGVLALMDLPSDFKVGKYGVDVTGFEIFLELLSFSSGVAGIFMMDEIGKMECFSEKFKTLALKLLDSEKTLIATIAKKGGGLIAEIKKRADIKLFEVTRQNQNAIISQVLGLVDFYK